MKLFLNKTFPGSQTKYNFFIDNVVYTFFFAVFEAWKLYITLLYNREESAKGVVGTNQAYNSIIFIANIKSVYGKRYVE